MAGYVEGDRSADDLVAEGFDPAAVDRVVGLVDRAEYKRRQMPPGVRISGKAFGKDRRMPITNHYRSVAPGAAEPAGPSGARTAGPRSVALDGSSGELRRLSELLRPTGPRPGPCPRPGGPGALPAGPRGHGRASSASTAGSRPRSTATLGEWVGDMPIAGVQVHLDAQSMRHAWHAELFADRLPVRAGVDPDALDPPVGGRPPRCSPPWTGSAPPGRGSGLDVASRRPRTSSGPPGPCPGWPASTGWCCPGWSPPTPATSGWSPRWPTARCARALRLVLRDEVEDWLAGERLVQRLVSRPHDVAAVYEFQEHLEAVAVAAGAHSGLVTIAGAGPGRLTWSRGRRAMTSRRA